jgi:hypothetical protein
MEKNREELKKFILSDNKSGYKTKRVFFEKNLPLILNDIDVFVKTNKLSDLSFIVQLYHYIHKLNEVPTCPICNISLKFGKSLNEGYGKYCSINCTNKSESHINKSKSTNIKKYGGVSPMSSLDIRKKISETNLNKYGVKNIFEKKDYIQSQMEKKYGEKFFTKTDEYRKKMKIKYQEKYKDLNISKNDNDIIFECPNCSVTSIHDYNSFNYRTKHNINLCKSCVPPYQSSIESEFENFLNELNIPYIRHNRTLIAPKEIDFYLESLGIGFEMNGLYYHSEKFLDNDYHKSKWENCLDKKINLIQIFEDEWKNRKNIIKEIILNKLNPKKESIYARKCQVHLIDNDIYKYFVENYHIQGYSAAKIRLGLFYENELVQVMSFSSNRKSLGSNSVDGNYEMIRLCSMLKYRIIGGSNKLLNYFEKNFKPNKITSYCDNRYFTGKSYTDMGFELVKITKPNYFYIKQNEIKRYNRFNFRKDRLVKLGLDINSTEKELMTKLGYLRIYDAGNKKFEKVYF